MVSLKYFFKNTSRRIRLLFASLLLSPGIAFSQSHFPHLQAHAHNDYEHARPLKDALANGFISVEADVHLQNDKLLVSHNRPGPKAQTLEQLYLKPIDSLLSVNRGKVYPDFEGPFFLMIDCKTDAESTLLAIQKELKQYPMLLCLSQNCAVKIFLSGNRDLSTMMKEGYRGIGLDGRPSDLGKNYSNELMPVISDHFRNWSSWNGKSKPSIEDLEKVKTLAARVHAEGKKLRLWAIPDNETAWEALLAAGIDLINTDQLLELNQFLSNHKP